MNRMHAAAAVMGAAVVLFSVPPAPAAQPAAQTGTQAGRSAQTGTQTGPQGQAARAPVRAAAPVPCTGEFQGDGRLGPAYLAEPWQQPMGPLLTGYERTGGLAPEVFLDKYWTGDGWKYPPNEGFAEVNGALDKWPSRLGRGERLDRFGSEYGRYLAPAGDPYGKRALPPQSLTTRDAAHPCNYHLYRVSRPFTVWQGSIAPWFEQPGGGQQILLDPLFLPPSQRPGEGAVMNVQWLVRQGYLTPVPAPGARTGG